MIEAADWNQILSKRKAISVLLPHAIHLGRGGQREMVDAILRAAMASNSEGFLWNRMARYINTLFDGPSPPPLDRSIALIFPHSPLYRASCDSGIVVKWATGVAELPYTDEVGRGVVDTLLQIAYSSGLRSQIPNETWGWMKRPPSLPPVCRGRRFGSSPYIVCHIRGLGDIEILKSYLLLVWSEWGGLDEGGLCEMRVSIREDFDGVGMGHHREDLIERLDYVLGRLDWGLGYFRQYESKVDEDGIRVRKEQYGELKEVLLEGDRGVTDILTRKNSKLSLFDGYTDTVDVYRVSFDLHLCSASPVFVTSHLRKLPRVHMSAQLCRLIHSVRIMFIALFCPLPPFSNCRTVPLGNSDRCCCGTVASLNFFPFFGF
jgi:hypothetical protein